MAIHLYHLQKKELSPFEGSSLALVLWLPCDCSLLLKSPPSSLSLPLQLNGTGASLFDSSAAEGEAPNKASSSSSTRTSSGDVV